MNKYHFVSPLTKRTTTLSTRWSPFSRCFFIALVLVLAGCSDSSDNKLSGTPSSPEFDFSAVESALGEFIAASEEFSGASIIIEHRTYGSIYEHALGDFTLDTRAAVASVSKSATAALLLALASDPALEFDIDTPIQNYLPWVGAYPDVTAGQMLSNTSGMPNIRNYQANPPSFGNHLCQLHIPDQFFNAATLLGCAQGIYETLLPDALPAGSQFRYGGSDWQLAGGLAEVVGGAGWGQLFDQYVAEPCGLETFEWARTPPNEWDYSLEALAPGHPNPNIQGGAIATVKDLARLVSLYLYDGVCGDTQVLSESTIMAARIDRGSPVGSLEHRLEFPRAEEFAALGYGLGFWIKPPDDGSEPSLFLGIGAYGSYIWYDTVRGYAGSILLANYPPNTEVVNSVLLIENELIPMIGEIIDSAR